MQAINTVNSRSILEKVRKILLAILALGMAGTLAELVLLKHTEDLVQWVPMILLSAAGAVLIWHGTSEGAASLRLIRWLMYGFIAAGMAGIYFHFRGSAEFKLESQPNLAGMALFWQAISAKTPPFLAPGAMVQLGLLGLLYTYKHPLLKQRKEEGD
jgi:hypothetical protein